MFATNYFLSIRIKCFLSRDRVEYCLVFWRCWFKPFFVSSIFLEEEEKSHICLCATCWVFALGVGVFVT